jgi:glutaredoxin
MKIEFLYFSNCPGYKSTLSLLEQIIVENDFDVSIEKIEITNEELAIQHRFLGSPSIRINGKDIEGREKSSEYGLKCRIYPNNLNVPPEPLLRKALQEAA